MSLGGAYQPVGLPNTDGNEQEDFQDEPQQETTPSRMEPLELGTQSSNHKDETTVLLGKVNEQVVEPSLSIAITTVLVIPTLLLAMIVALHITSRIWTSVLFAMHLLWALVKARVHFQDLEKVSRKESAASSDTSANFPTSTYSDRAQENTDDPATSENDNHDGQEEEESEGVPLENGTTHHTSKGIVHFWLTSFPSLLDIILFGLLYPAINGAFRDFFVDFDGEPIVEWTHYHRAGQAFGILSNLIVLARIGFGGRMLVLRMPASTYYLTTSYYSIQSLPMVGPTFRKVYQLWLMFKIFFSTPPKPLSLYKNIHMGSLALAAIFLIWTIYSTAIHFGPSTPGPHPTDVAFCDPIDETECCLPFPSFYHLREDDTTDTGYRVQLLPESFPMLRGRIPIPTNFLNNLDGFSTMGPLLFYMEGMKESHEHFVQQIQDNPELRMEAGKTRLRGHQELELSVTPYSTTLLLDVDATALVPHSAEIDYLDPERPLVMVFPAKPLKHNTHYALAVLNATDADGNRLPPTRGMTDLWETNTNGRKEIYTDIVIPALERATSTMTVRGTTVDWGGPFGSFARSKDPQALQMLFDFHTISMKSQLGPARAVRDGVLGQVGGSQWNWDEHARVVRQIDYNCDDREYPLARTIHGELDVPWFMKGFGPGYRETTLDANSVSSGTTTTIGKAKFVAHVPCSLKLKAQNKAEYNNMTAQPLRAVMEFGHGLFYNRQEAGSKFLIKEANQNGYIIVAMDWRGMSIYDFPLVMRTMLADPSLFESVRDNLIQGYGNKYALQHFIKNGGMLERDWFQFSSTDSRRSLQTQAIPQEVKEGKTLPSVFYGISQGGILGAGYVALSGPTGLIDRGILGVPGTPFSLILSRSMQFVGYDAALLLNFYNNRDVRVFLSLAQMCWDSVEGSGVLAQPAQESVPPMLLQAGLGDAIVPTLAAERLARALGAATLPHNPRAPIYEIPPGKPADDTNVGPKVTLTEMLYKDDYASLPLDNELKAEHNHVHLCVRLEPAMQRQIHAFVNDAKIIDPCSDPEACVKETCSRVGG